MIHNPVSGWTTQKCIEQNRWLLPWPLPVFCNLVSKVNRNKERNYRWCFPPTPTLSVV